MQTKKLTSSQIEKAKKFLYENATNRSKAKSSDSKVRQTPKQDKRAEVDEILIGSNSYGNCFVKATYQDSKSFYRLDIDAAEHDMWFQVAMSQALVIKSSGIFDDEEENNIWDK